MPSIETFARVLWATIWIAICLILIRSLWRQYRLRETHCRSCGYDLRGLALNRCPECGKPKTQSTHRRMVAVRFVLIAITLALATISLVPRQFALDRWVWWNREELHKQQCTIGDLSVEGCAIVYNGFANPHSDVTWMRLGYMIKLHRAGSEVFRLFLSEPNSHLSESLIGLDFTGDCIGDIVVESVSFDRKTYIIIDAALLTSARLDREYGDELRIVQSPKDPNRLGIRIRDREFTCWEGSGGPAPFVVLNMENGKLVPDIDMMRAPPPSLDSLEAWADEICLSFPTEYGSEWGLLCETGMLQPMLDLVFSGHPDLAERFLERACPTDLSDRRSSLLKTFHQRLRESQYWPSIVHLAPDYWQAVEAK